mgnify:FL=1
MIKREKEGKGFEELEHLTLGSLRKAVFDGNIKEGSFMAGQIAGLVDKEQTAQEIIEDIMKDTDRVLKQFCK